MTRFFFNILDGREIIDKEGQEYRDLNEAREDPRLSARSIMREAIREGRLPLSEKIEIADSGGNVLETVYFKDVVRIE